MLSGHIGPVISICYFPDKEKIISVSLDNTLKVWNSSMRNNIKKRLINQSQIYATCFSPDGKTFISGSQDNTLKIFDSYTG